MNNNLFKNNVGRVVGHFKSYQKDKGEQGKVTFLIGAGASKSAGIPTAPELLSELHEHETFGYLFNGFTEENKKNYGKCMSALLSHQRKDFLQPFLDNADINWGHIALAQLIDKGFISRVLSFNFDLLLERAAALLNTQLPVFDFGVAPHADMHQIVSPALIHLHGQSYGHRLMNSSGEVEEHKQKVAPLFKDTLSQHAVFVLGYSAESDSSLELIDSYIGDTRVIWLGYDHEPTAAIQRLVDKHDCFEYFGGCDFDTVMVELAKQSNVWEPKLFKNPIEHTLLRLEGLADYPIIEESQTDILVQTKKQLQDLVDHWKTSTTESQAFSSDDEELMSLTEDDDPTLKAWLYVRKGDALADQAELASGDRALELYGLSLDKYEQALAIKPDMHEALYNWGVTLAGQAKLESGGRALELNSLASEKYEQSLAINPDDHDALNNLGNTLGEQAKLESGSRALELYNLASEKYEQALIIKPDKHVALNNWGTNLGDHAKLESGGRALELYNLALEKYEQALSIKPDMHEVLNNWGTTLSDHAKLETGSGAMRLLNLALEKYEQALAIKPDYSHALNNCANTLGEQAKLESGGRALELYRLASEKYEQALVIKPDDNDTLNNWASTLSHHSKLESGDRALRLLRQMESVLNRAMTIDPEETFYNMGCCQAMLGHSEFAIDYLEKSKKANTLPPVEHLEEDLDLASLKEHPRFKALLTLI